VEGVIESWLANGHPGKPPSCRHKRTYLRLAKTGPVHLDGYRLFQGIYDQICANWDESRLTPSSENWRWEPKTKTSPQNKSLEVTLERAIVQVGGPGWTNQVPTASGLCGARKDKRRCLDLVHRIGPKAFEFIELKWESGNPVYAAMEVICYGMIHLFTRSHLRAVYPTPSSRPEILSAKEVDLRVLAPRDFYEGPDFAWFEHVLDRGLSGFVKNLGLGVTMTFQYCAFPRAFAWPCDQTMLRSALQEIGPAFPSRCSNTCSCNEA
jgi:hypothetical protein